MTKARRGPKRQETLSRYVLITDCRGDVSVRIDRGRGRLPTRVDSSTIEVLGHLHEPLDGITQASVMVFPTTDLSLGNTTPLSIGSVLSTKPVFQAALHLPENEFSKLWALVAANQVKSCHIMFTQPYRRHAYIININFSSGLPDEEDV